MTEAKKNISVSAASTGRRLSTLALFPLGLSSGVLLANILIPEPAFAAGGEGAGLSSLFFPLINFSIFSFILWRIYNKNIAGLLRARSASTKEELNNSANKLQSATSEFEGLRDRLNNIDIEKRELFARFDTEGANQSRQILESANRQTRRKASDAERQVEAERSRAEKGLRSLTLEKALRLAEAKFKKEHGLNEDAALREEALRSL